MSDLDRIPIVEYRSEDRPLVERFWRDLLGEAWNEAARRRWEWLNSRRTHFLVRDDDRILGNATLLRQPFSMVGGETAEVGWITDFYVSPELKGRGMGKRLTRRLMEATPNPATFGQSEDARRCFSRVDWSGPVGVPVLGFSIPGRRSFARVGLRMERVDSEDARIDAVWEARGPRKCALGTRDSAALSTRLVGRPDAAYEVWLGSANGAPVGFAVLRSIAGRRNRMFGRVPVGLLVDVLAADDSPEVLRDLVRFGLRRLGRRGALVALAVGTRGTTGEVLRAEGFGPGVGIRGLHTRALPEKGFMIGPAAVSTLGLEPHLSFLDCDAELTF